MYIIFASCHQSLKRIFFISLLLGVGRKAYIISTSLSDRGGAVLKASSHTSVAYSFNIIPVEQFHPLHQLGLRCSAQVRPAGCPVKLTYCCRYAPAL